MTLVYIRRGRAAIWRLVATRKRLPIKGALPSSPWSHAEMLDKRRYQTLIGYTNMPWQKASGWLFMTLLSATMVTSFLPGRAYAQSLGPASLDPQSQPSTTPAANSPLIIPSPSQGPVKTLVTLQGTDWPPESQVLLSYDNDPGCSGPNLTELSP